MIERDLERAENHDHDVVVVGGGVYGIAHALEASRLGLRVCLLERGDFAGATSSNSLRIVHGGLRYLQTADLVRFFESVDERRWLLRHFPDLVFPLSCLMPLYGDGPFRPAVMRAALAVNDVLTAGRNRDVTQGREIPRGRILSPEVTREMFPKVEVAGLRGAALWYDATVPRSQRLMMEMLRWACHRGAVALNYVEATGLDVRDGTVRGVEAEETGAGDGSRRSIVVRAPIVINCAGPWCRVLAAKFDRDVPELFHPSLALNVVLATPALSKAALAVRARRSGASTFFVCPWRGEMMAGTYHAPFTGPAGERHPGEHDAEQLDGLVEGFLAELNAALPGQHFSQQQVRRVHWGYLPARSSGSKRLAVRARILDHGIAGGPKGLFSVSGVKLTTAGAVARKTMRRIGLPPGRRFASAPASRPEPVSVPSSSELARLLTVDRSQARTSIRRLVREESVVSLEDLLLRRTDWGHDPDFESEHARQVAELAGLSGPE